MAIGKWFGTTFGRLELMQSNQTVTAGVPVRLGNWPVPLGKVAAWGRGADLGLEDTEGRIYIDIRDAGASPGLVVNGLLRLVAINQLGQEQEVYWEGRTEQARLGATVLRDRMPLPAQEPVIPAGFSLAVSFVSDTTATLGVANCLFQVDGRRARRLGG